MGAGWLMSPQNDHIFIFFVLVRVRKCVELFYWNWPGLTLSSPIRFSSADRRTKSMICNVEWRAKKWRKMTKICELEPHFPFDNGLFSASSGELDVHFPLWKCIISLVTDPEPPKKNCSDALACVLHAFSVVFQMCAISFQWFSFIFSCGFSCFSATFQLLFSYFSAIFPSFLEGIFEKREVLFWFFLWKNE